MFLYQIKSCIRWYASISFYALSAVCVVRVLSRVSRVLFDHCKWHYSAAPSLPLVAQCHSLSHAGCQTHCVSCLAFPHVSIPWCAQCPPQSVQSTVLCVCLKPAPAAPADPVSGPLHVPPIAFLQVVRALAGIVVVQDSSCHSFLKSGPTALHRGTDSHPC